MRARFLIVGGGVMGTAIALELARRTDPIAEPVVLCERTRLGAGSSGRSGAILRTFYSDRAVSRMARDSLRAYASFQGRTGRPIGFHRTGVFTIAGPDDPAWHEKLGANAAMMRELGIDVRLLNGSELRELVPGIAAPDGTLAAWEPDGGFVDPARTVEAFAAQARVYGAVTRLGTAVERIRVARGRATGAVTSEGELDAAAVVLVAGPWSGALLAELGVEIPLRIVRPENHFLALPAREAIRAGAAGGSRPHADATPASATADRLREPEPLTAPALGALHGAGEMGPGSLSLEEEALVAGADHGVSAAGLDPVLIDLERGFYARAEPETARMRVGHVDYDHDAVLARPEDLVEEVGDETKRWARDALGGRLPRYADRPDAGSIAAWYTMTPDAQAVIGPVPGIAGLYVVTGFSGHGFKLAPSVGEGVTQMLLDEPVTAFDVDFFAPDRFRPGAAWGGRFGL
jgi:glycine/D-amino acid oxidase-like deaminating enzyme